MILTGKQLKELFDFLGGNLDTEVQVEELPERTLDPGTGAEPTTFKAGTWAWVKDYPEEGTVLLEP